MGAKRPTTGLPDESKKLARELHADGVSFRGIVRELQARGLPGGLSAVHAACTAADEAAPAKPSEPPAPSDDGEERALELEGEADRALEVLGRLIGAAGAIVKKSSEAGGPEIPLSVVLKAMTALGKETERAVKLARILRGRPTGFTSKTVTGKVEHQHTEAERRAVGALGALRVVKGGAAEAAG